MHCCCCCCCVASVMSDSVRPHRRQPTRLPHPWDSPGKNTGVGCHFLLQCRKVKSESEVAQSCLTLSGRGSIPSWGIKIPRAASHTHTHTHTHTQNYNTSFFPRPFSIGPLCVFPRVLTLYFGAEPLTFRSLHPHLTGLL